MPGPGEHKTVQARILHYAQDIGWRYVSRADAEARRGFDSDGATAEDSARTAALYFGDLLHSQVLAFNSKYKEAEGALIGEFRRLNADIAGNRDFLTYLRNAGKFFCAEENRELDLTLIDYDDLARHRSDSPLPHRDTRGDGTLSGIYEVVRNACARRVYVDREFQKKTNEGQPQIAEEFARFANWRRSEAELRELRKQVTFAVFAEEDDLEKVTATVEALFTLLQKSFRP